MVTLIKYGALGGGEKYNTNQMWIDGLSTDAKPTATIDGMPIPNGSVFTEVDTGKTYMFDKDNTTWYEVSLGGGGGGGGTSNYNALSNRPQINGTTLTGNKTGSDLGLQDKVLGAWTAGTATTHSTPASTDTVLQALEKIDNNQRLDETNISLKANTSDVNTATANLQAQINNIVTPVTQDAEVENARVDANGISYATLKTRCDGDYDKLSSEVNDISDWAGYAQNLINCNAFKITNTTNWGLTTTIDSITVVHNNTYSTGYPAINLNLPVGTYKFTADFSESSAKAFALNKNGSYSKTVNNGDTITIEANNTYSLGMSPSSAGTYIIKDIRIVNASPNGKYQEIEGEIDNINAKLSGIKFEKVYKPVNISETEYSFIQPDGTIKDTAQSDNYVVSQYIEINTDKVKVTASANWGNNYYAFYDNNKAFISGATSATGSTITTITNEVVNVPTNAKYIVIAAIKTANVIKCEVYADIIVIDNGLNQPKLSEKMWCVIGDSLTDKSNSQAPIRYFDYLSVDSTTIANLGKSGTGYLQTYNTNGNFVDVVDDLTGNEDYDVISVMGGINDSGHIGTDYQLGQLGDTEPTTIYGAIYYVFNSLITKFPLAFVFAITSPVTSYRHDLGNNIDVIQQAVREVCAWLKIPVADVNKNAPMRPWIADFATQYYHDQAHPNSAGHEIIAKAMTNIFDYM